MKKTAMDRREILKLGALTLAGVAIPLQGCASQKVLTDSGSPLRLPRIRVEEDRIIRQVAGLRPFRPSGFVVKSEKLGSKTVIHNYGHGGCGVTLSWGSADQAARLALETPLRHAAVVGGGAVGLATARLLQDRGFQVSLYARELSPDTTSDIAGAAFGVTSIVDRAHETAEIAKPIQEAARFAHRKFQTMLGQKYAVRWLDIYLIDEEPLTHPWDFAVTPELYRLTPYTGSDNPFGAKHAAKFTTMMIEPTKYLGAVFDDFLIRGGKVEVKDFPSQSELTRLKEPLIFNCTGLGAKALFNDPELTAVKGQLTFLAPQPEVDYGYIDGRNFSYMFPRSDGILLGGSHDKDDFSTAPDEKARKHIFDGNKKISLAMKT